MTREESLGGRLAGRIRRTVIERAYAAHVGHIGSALSIVDILAALYGDVINGMPDDPNRDRLVLSKGHAALALYAALAETGRLDRALLDEYCSDGTVVGVHPEHLAPGIDFSTGSLGQGLSLGTGAALAARLDGSARRSFVVVSDAECNEGSVWEAVMFAAHHKLANLVAIIDLNGQQAFGYTRDVLDLSPLGDRFRAVGWDVHDADGTNPDELAHVINALDTHSGAPHVVIAKTIFGRGVSFMESTIDWHYWPLNDEQYAQALAELEAAS